MAAHTRSVPLRQRPGHYHGGGPILAFVGVRQGCGSKVVAVCRSSTHGRLRLDKKSIIRQYRNLQRAKTKSNIISHYTVHVLRTTNHTYFETFSKNK